MRGGREEGEKRVRRGVRRWGVEDEKRMRRVREECEKSARRG